MASVPDTGTGTVLHRTRRIHPHKEGANADVVAVLPFWWCIGTAPGEDPVLICFWVRCHLGGGQERAGLASVEESAHVLRIARPLKEGKALTRI